MKKILVIGLVIMFLLLIFSYLVPAEQSIRSDNEWGYLLKYGDVEQEVRRQYIGQSQVPWTAGLH